MQNCKLPELQQRRTPERLPSLQENQLTKKVCLGGREKHFDVLASSQLKAEASLLTGREQERDSKQACVQLSANLLTPHQTVRSVLNTTTGHNGPSGPIRPCPKAFTHPIISSELVSGVGGLLQCFLQTK